jgi:hypothetical protein
VGRRDDSIINQLIGVWKGRSKKREAMGRIETKVPSCFAKR